MGMDAFFRQGVSGRRTARAVCIDTEPKVIERLVERADAKREKSWLYDSRSTAFTHGGAGNNWAQGYGMCSGEFMETSLNCIRRELEHSDWPSCLGMLNSLGGGTGSGFGTRVAEAVADEFPDSTRVNILISPYHFGEVVVQNYNALLCLSKVATCSHGVITFENETARDLCTTMRAIKSPSLADVNRTIAQHLLPILLPRQRAGSHVSSSLVNDVSHLCAHPGLKFLDIKMTPQTPDASVVFTFESWTAIMRTLGRMSVLGVQSERGLSRPVSSDGIVPQETMARVYASSLVMRGMDARTVAAEFAASSTCPSSMQVHWSDTQVTYQRSAALLSNGQSVLPVLQRPIYKAADMFRAGAFLHQYTKFGLEMDDFTQSFQVLGQAIENYKNLELRT